jgi:hypothetical protein
MPSRLSSVVHIDLDAEEGPLETLDDLIRLNLSRLGPNLAVLGSDRGIERPWNIVLTCSIPNLEKHDVLFESVLTNAVRPRLVLLLRAPELANGSSRLSLPRVFSEQSQLVRVVVLTSETGSEWAPSEHKVKGIALWHHDQEGRETLPILEETLTMPEVFDSLFSESSSSQFEAWCIGTRQVWFGKLPAQPLAAALFEVGEGLVGDDGKIAVLRRLDEWQPPLELVGGAAEADILVEGGKKKNHLKAIRTQIDALSKSAGIGQKTGFIARVADSPALQTGVLDRLTVDLRSLSTIVREILESIDASDGFGVDERRMMDREGIQLNRPDDQRERFENLDSAMLETVVDGIKRAITQGHSLAPLKIQVEDLIEKVTPRSKERILEEFVEVNLTKEIAQLETAATKFPKSPLMRLGRRVARVLQPMWSRFILLALYLWGLITTCFEIFDKGSTRGFIPLPQAARATASALAVVLFVVLTLTIMVLGLILNMAHSKIVAWGKTTGVTKLPAAVNAMESYLQRTAMNDWVLSKVRRASVLQLQYLLEGLERLAALIRELLIDGSDHLGDADGTEYSPNPAVRRDFNDYAKVGVFKNMKMVIEILRMDVATIMETKLELRVPELRGKFRGNFPDALLEDVSEPLREYVDSVIRKGALSQDLAQSEEAVQLRRDLTDSYWKDVSVIDKVIQDVVLVGDTDPIVQFINPQNLLLVAKDVDDAVNVRFAPEPSRGEVSKAPGVQTELASTVVFTEAVTSAGIVRMVGLRQGFVSYR